MHGVDGQAVAIYHLYLGNSEPGGQGSLSTTLIMGYFIRLNGLVYTHHRHEGTGHLAQLAYESQELKSVNKACMHRFRQYSARHIWA